MSRFIAIPVGAGDSFFLELHNGLQSEPANISILVDGGNSVNNLPKLFCTHTARNGVDILICTHNDADHANGVLGFLQSNLQCQEVWLPGSWIHALPGVLDRPEKVIERLQNEIRLYQTEFGQFRFDYQHMKKHDMVTTIVEGQANQRRFSPKSFPLTNRGWPELVVHRLHETGTWSQRPKSNANKSNVNQSLAVQTDSQSSRHLMQLPPRVLKELFKVIRAANKIRDIAIEAYKRGLKVRWFEYDTHNPSGGEHHLQPLNARELTAVSLYPPTASLLALLALSIENQQSLVFWSPATDTNPGVLFTADSDLKNIKLPTDISHAIITTPHHGSKANATAYKLLTSISGSATSTWVRSDGHYKRNPTNHYLNLTNQRFCTLCQLAMGRWSKHQAVGFVCMHGRWVSHNTSCDCR